MLTLSYSENFNKTLNDVMVSNLLSLKCIHSLAIKFNTSRAYSLHWNTKWLIFFSLIWEAGRDTERAITNWFTPQVSTTRWMLKTKSSLPCERWEPNCLRLHLPPGICITQKMQSGARAGDAGQPLNSYIDSDAFPLFVASATFPYYLWGFIVSLGFSV